MWYASFMRVTPDKFMASLDLPEVYRVGGSVRDELLGRESKDSDYMVRLASLADLESALNQSGVASVRDLRLRDGRVVGKRVSVRGLGLLEIALPRTEVPVALTPEQVFQGGGVRRAFEIITDPNLPLEKDAERRDFTINALYRNVRSGEVIDGTGQGLSDLEAQVLRTTHPDSFRDDPLRTLRALRFVSKLNFVLSAECISQMCEHASSVTGLTAGGYASGTVLHELSGILMGSQPAKALRLMRDTGVMAVLFPELAPMIGFEQRSVYHSKTTDEHTFDAVQAAANMHRNAPLRVRLALLFHDAGKPESAWTGADGQQHYYRPSLKQWEKLTGDPVAVQEFCDDRPEDHEVIGARLANTALRRLGASNELRRDVVTLIERHMLPLHQNVKPTKVRYWRAELGDALLRDLIVHRLADVIGKGGEIEEAVEVLQWIEHQRQRAVEAGVPVNAKGLKINGHDLIALGLEGREIGRVQKALLHEVVAQPKLNEREWLLNRAENLARSS